jgi:predicted regulator of Ras-like GTPase activity (Roadblock/LC7/MglB family)
MRAHQDTIASRLFAGTFAGRDGILHGILASIDGLLEGKPFGSLSPEDAERLAAIAATVIGASHPIHWAFATDHGGDGNSHTLIRAGIHDYLMLAIDDRVIVVLFVDATIDFAALLQDARQFGERLRASPTLFL